MILPTLDPCPFCGNELQPTSRSRYKLDFEDEGWGADISDDPEYPDYCWKVICYRCGANGPSHGTKDNYFSRAEAAARWNKRRCS